MTSSYTGLLFSPFLYTAAKYDSTTYEEKEILICLKIIVCSTKTNVGYEQNEPSLICNCLAFIIF